MSQQKSRRKHADLVAACVRGERAAFRQLYLAYVQDVHRQVARLCGWGPAAEDITQEVFIEVFKALPRYRGDAELSTWFYRLTRNVTISCLRRRGPEMVELAGHRALVEVVAQPDIDARRQVAALRAALADVSIEARDAFIQFELEGKTLAQIAEISGEPLHTIASRVRRTRERLRTVIGRAATSSAMRKAQ